MHHLFYFILPTMPLDFRKSSLTIYLTWNDKMKMTIFYALVEKFVPTPITPVVLD